MAKKLAGKRAAASLGAAFGAIVGTASVTSEVVWSDFDPLEPIYRRILEIGGYGVAGALLFAAAAWISNRLFRASSPFGPGPSAG
jgi:hypothetical protein